MRRWCPHCWTYSLQKHYRDINNFWNILNKPIWNTYLANGQHDLDLWDEWDFLPHCMVLHDDIHCPAAIRLAERIIIAYCIYIVYNIYIRNCICTCFSYLLCSYTLYNVLISPGQKCNHTDHTKVCSSQFCSHSTPITMGYFPNRLTLISLNSPDQNFHSKQTLYKQIIWKKWSAVCIGGGGASFKWMPRRKRTQD